MANVLVIVLDDVGATERPLLASMDDLAAQGMEFERFYAWPVCSPTRYAALTGRYPRRADIGDVVNAFDSSTGASPAPRHTDLMLPEVLKPSHATALIGKWHLGRASVGARRDLLDVTESGPFVSGFDDWLAGNPNSIAQGTGASGYFDWYRVDNQRVQTNHSTYATRAQRDAVLSWWGAATGPKFAWLALNAAHAPYDPPPGTIATGTERGDYLQVVHYADDAIRDVLATVNLADTYVLIFGDNGTPDGASVGPRGFWKGTTYEGGIRVPFVIAGPGIGQGVSSRLVSATDIGPTLMEMIGISARGFDDGLSFADELGSWAGDPARAFVFSERYDVPGAGVQPEGYDDIAIVEDAWKLRRVDVDGFGAGPPTDLAYYLPSDPYEIHPLDPLLLPPPVRSRLYAELATLPARP